MGARAPGPTITRAQYRFFSALTQILVYIVVLNLFVEYVDTVIIDSFTVSILTSILLWLMLRAILRGERRVAGYFSRKPGVVYRVLRLVSVWAILFVSKFVILEVVAFVFAGRAALGHFLEIVLITLALMAAEALLRWVYGRLGTATPASRGKPGSSRQDGVPED
jgi:hypothetical protein